MGKKSQSNNEISNEIAKRANSIAKRSNVIATIALVVALVLPLYSIFYTHQRDERTDLLEATIYSPKFSINIEQGQNQTVYTITNVAEKKISNMKIRVYEFYSFSYSMPVMLGERSIVGNTLRTTFDGTTPFQDYPYITKVKLIQVDDDGIIVVTPYASETLFTVFLKIEDTDNGRFQFDFDAANQRIELIESSNIFESDIAQVLERVLVNISDPRSVSWSNISEYDNASEIEQIMRREEAWEQVYDDALQLPHFVLDKCMYFEISYDDYLGEEKSVCYLQVDRKQPRSDELVEQDFRDIPNLKQYGFISLDRVLNNSDAFVDGVSREISICVDEYNNGTITYDTELFSSDFSGAG